MTRLRADLLLLLVALIWGAAFVAQKTALEHMGPAAFSALRFALSMIVILPLVLRERRRNRMDLRQSPATARDAAVLALSFILGVLLQQYGVAESTVARSGFLTGLYVLFTPLIGAVFYRQKLSGWILPAAALAVAGVFFLSGGKEVLTGSFGRGEWLLLGCAAAWGAQVVVVGRLVMKTRTPFQLCFFQYAAAVAGAGLVALCAETTALSGILAAWRELLYAGVVSGGLAYTIQVIAQQYTPASDCAVICSAESVFAALAGVLLMGEFLTGMAIVGCLLIVIAILTVELAPRRSEAC